MASSWCSFLGNVLNDLPLVALLSQCCQDLHNSLVPIQGVPIAVLAVAHDFLLLGQEQLVVSECRLSLHQWLQVWEFGNTPVVLEFLHFECFLPSVEFSLSRVLGNGNISQVLLICGLKPQSSKKFDDEWQSCGRLRASVPRLLPLWPFRVHHS